MYNQSEKRAVQFVWTALFRSIIKKLVLFNLVALNCSAVQSSRCRLCTFQSRIHSLFPDPFSGRQQQGISVLSLGASPPWLDRSDTTDHVLRHNRFDSNDGYITRIVLVPSYAPTILPGVRLVRHQAGFSYRES